MKQMMTFRKALNLAMADELKNDESVFIFGLDVDDHKSIFGSMDGLLKDFGSERIFGTPLSEEAMTGFAIGTAVRGLKPVHVHIRADFSLLAVNQIVNMASNIHYLTAGQLSVPLTIRVVIGRGWGQGLQHSKSVHAMFSHFPGLKVVMPSTAQEAYSLLRHSIQDPNPVIFIEHRWLYDVEGSVDTSKVIAPNTSHLLAGESVTVVANSWMSVEALKAAEHLKGLGITLDVFNVSNISDIDVKPIVESIAKTKHCIVVDHDWNNYGFNSEVATLVYEKSFNHLKKPIVRIGQKFFPCPTARPLEDKFYPKAQDIIRAACDLMSQKSPALNDAEFYSYENKFKGPF